MAELLIHIIMLSDGSENSGKPLFISSDIDEFNKKYDYYLNNNIKVRYMKNIDVVRCTTRIDTSKGDLYTTILGNSHIKDYTVPEGDEIKIINVPNIDIPFTNN